VGYKKSLVYFGTETEPFKERGLIISKIEPSTEKGY
jgi:hypothetical protein